MVLSGWTVTFTVSNDVDHGSGDGKGVSLQLLQGERWDPLPPEVEELKELISRAQQPPKK